MDSLKKVLVLDDEQFIVDLLKSIFVDGKTEVEAYVNGLSAKEAIQKTKFDIIIADYLMPNYSGADFVKDIRRTSNPNKDTPILIVTARRAQAEADIEIWEKILIMDKPITIPKLASNLMQVLKE